MKLNNFLKKKDYSSYDWILLSDYYMEMAMVLMVILSMTTTNQMDLKDDLDKIDKITSTWKNTKELIYNALLKEFESDLKKWDATLDKETLSVRFHEPSIQFNTGSDDIKVEFKSILSDFWPRYINVVHKYADNQVQEIRIEGHTSSLWIKNASQSESYFGNMELSQSRARSVLKYCYQQESPYTEWASKYITANGLSFSKVIHNEDGSENHNASQRVEFRVILDTEKKIKEIMDGESDG